jgi:hypothetical protein
MKPYHFKEILKQGYSADIIFLLEMIEQGLEVKQYCNTPKLEVLWQTIERKQLVTETMHLSADAKALLDFIRSEEPSSEIVQVRIEDEKFDKWWKAYPGTDTFTYKGKSFQGTRAMRVKKEECKGKMMIILQEGEYSIDDLIKALEFDVLQKKENSIKTGANKLTYMQNSLTYLNQRSFEPFIELVKQGAVVQETVNTTGGTDI